VLLVAAGKQPDAPCSSSSCTAHTRWRCSAASCWPRPPRHSSSPAGPSWAAEALRSCRAPACSRLRQPPSSRWPSSLHADCGVSDGGARREYQGPHFLSAALISNVRVLSAALSVVVQRWWSCQHGVPPVQSATGTSRRPVHGGRAAGVNAICRYVIGRGTGLSARGTTRWGCPGVVTSKAAGQAEYATAAWEPFFQTCDISQRRLHGPHCGDVDGGSGLVGPTFPTAVALPRCNMTLTSCN
jgi:hypothetical protein